MGTASDYRWSIPIDDSIDRGRSRTSQRAELLAAIHGLKKINEVEMDQAESIRKHGSTAYRTHPHVNSLGMREFVPKYVVVTDSRYVADGMTKWLPEWKVRNRISLVEITKHEPSRKTRGQILKGWSPPTLIFSPSWTILLRNMK